MRFRARSYLDRSYLGEEISAERRADAVGSNFNDTLILKYRGAYSAVSRLMPAERTKLWAALQAHLARLPADQRGTVIELYNQQKGKLDLRTPTGLGVVGAVSGAASSASTIANIAALVATLGTLGLGVAAFAEQRKENKAAASDRARIAAQEEAALKLQMDEQRARMERDRIAFDEQMAVLRSQQTVKPAGPRPTTPATMPGPTIEPDGTVTMEESAPAPASKTPMLVGAGLAIAAGLALVK